MIMEKLKAIISEQFGVDEDEITAATAFMEDLGADSLDLVELIMSVEEEFELGEIEDGAMESIKTVGDVARFISTKIED